MPEQEAAETGASSDFRKIPDDLLFAPLDKKKLTQMYLPIRTIVRLIQELHACKTRYAPAWSNAIWASIGLFLPTLANAITDISNQNRSHQPISITVSMAFAGIFFVALVISACAYFTTGQAENASIDRVVNEMRDVLEPFLEGKVEVGDHV
jgi:hypothetical protein